MLIDGEVQRSKENVVHLMVDRVIDASAALQWLNEQPMMRGDEFHHPVHARATPSPRRHPRDVRILPKSRDFH
jgi:error-prone DNA polymerase